VDFSSVTAQLKAHAERVYPEECVGAVVRNASGALEVREFQNVSPEPRRRFLLSARDTLVLAQEDLVAIYHSHPDGSDQPSPEDLAQAWEGTWILVVPVRGGVAGQPSARFASRERIRSSS